MIDHAAADLVLLLHLAFIAFALAGALLVLRWRWLAWLQLPAAAWGLYIELSGRLCPLTTLENALRVAEGQAGYADGFVAHYLLALIYPSGLTRTIQFVLAGVVLAVNAGISAWLLWRRAPSVRGG